MQKKNLSVFITGFFIGGLIGSVTALLYTPVTGKKLRRDINRKKEQIIDNVSDMYETGKEKAEDIIKDGKKKAESIIADAKKIINVS